jgi:hypothetical protein
MLPPAYIGLTGEIGIPIGTRAVALGGKYQVFQSTIFSSNYDLDANDPYVSTQTSGSAFGAWSDFTYLRKSLTKKLIVNLNGGLGFDLYTVNVVTKKLTDVAAPAALNLADATVEGTQIISATAKLGLVSLRAGGRIDFQIIKNLGLSMGLTAIIPVAALMNSVTTDIAEGEDRGIADSKQDLTTGIGLAKSTVGLDVVVGAYASF